MVVEAKSPDGMQKTARLRVLKRMQLVQNSMDKGSRKQKKKPHLQLVCDTVKMVKRFYLYEGTDVNITVLPCVLFNHLCILFNHRSNFMYFHP